MVAGHLEVQHRPVRLVRGGEMTGQDAGHLFEPVCRRRLDGPGSPAVGPAPFSAGHTLVSRLLDEGVAKAVRRLGRAHRLLEHSGVAEFFQRRAQLVAAVPDRRQQRPGNLRPDHRGRAQSVMRRRAEPVSAASARAAREPPARPPLLAPPGSSAPLGAPGPGSRATKRTVPPRKKGSLARLNAIRR